VLLVKLLERASLFVKQKAKKVASLEEELSLKLEIRALKHQLSRREQQSNVSTPDLHPEPVPKVVCEAAVAAAQLIANEVSASSHQQRLLKLTFHTRSPSSSPQQFCKWFLGCDSARFLFLPLPPHTILDANPAFCGHLGLTRQLLTHSPLHAPHSRKRR
jgi:plasmid stability protein